MGLFGPNSGFGTPEHKKIDKKLDLILDNIGNDVITEDPELKKLLEPANITEEYLIKNITSFDFRKLIGSDPTYTNKINKNFLKILAWYPKLKAPILNLLGDEVKWGFTMFNGIATKTREGLLYHGERDQKKIDKAVKKVEKQIENDKIYLTNLYNQMKGKMKGGMRTRKLRKKQTRRR